MHIEYSGNLFIVAAPSGGGKSSLVKAVVEKISNVSVSISHTTRDQRPGEREGEHYYFVSRDVFLEGIAHHQFVEYATVFGQYYGTSKREVEARLAKGEDVILDIDWQGALSIKKHFKNAVSIFILPPSIQTLRDRLIGRQRDSALVIEQRMEAAKKELAHHVDFDYLVVNDDFQSALSDIIMIIKSDRLKNNRQTIVLKELLSLLTN